MKDDKERNYFSLRIMFGKCLFPMLKCYTKNLYTKLWPQIPLHVPHGYALLRRLVFEKNHFM